LAARLGWKNEPIDQPGGISDDAQPSAERLEQIGRNGG